jgi:uncharacterized membrane protein YoaK (UPF0700 family)
MINEAANFTALIVGSLGLLSVDGWLFFSGRKTISERIWRINQFSLALAFIAGVLAGHFFTVPK